MSVAAVVDFGSGVIKAGWAGEDAPAAAFRALVGEPKHARIMAGGALAGGGGGDGGYVCGASAVAHAGLLRLWAPVGGRGGAARDSRGLAALLAHAFGPAGLQARWCCACAAFCKRDAAADAPLSPFFRFCFSPQASASAQPLLLTEPPLAPACVREELAALAFDGALRVPALLLAAPAALALYGAGKTTVRASERACSLASLSREEEERPFDRRARVSFLLFRRASCST